ncbi:MAG: HU family DNA-binding protein [Bacteroidaceae bacterium]|nr:HU family DNA-binding protein [Bacteroidaceae bacterium]
MDKKLNLSQIAELLAVKSGMSKASSEKFTKTFFDIISDNTVAGESVKIKGLGTFKTIQVENRESVNVNTGERFVIPGYRKVNFIPDITLKEEINKPFSAFETLILTDSQAAVLAESKPELPVETVMTVESGPTDEHEPDESVPSVDIIQPKPVEPVQPVESGEQTAHEGPKVREITQKRGVRFLLNLLLWILFLLLILMVLAYLFWPLAGQKLLAVYDNKTARTEIVEQESRSSLTEISEPEPEQTQTVIQEENIQEREKPADKMPLSDLTEKEEVNVKPETPVQQASEPLAGQNNVQEKSPVVPEPQTAVSSSNGFRLTTADEQKDLGLFTVADTVNYRMTGTLTVHHVKEGETLTQISLAEYGTKKLWPYIAAYNKLRDSNSLNAGSRILIPSLEAR